MTGRRRPSPAECVRAYRTIKLLHQAVKIGAAADPDGRDVWELLVDAKRAVAVATSVLGADDPLYAAAWDMMMEPE